MTNTNLCLDLCSGKGGFSQAFVQDGWEVITVDIEPKFKPTVVADITTIDWAQFKRDILDDRSPDVLLASPPCERFSLMSNAWPKTGVKRALEIVGACLEAVSILMPKKWVIENPKARLRWFIGIPRTTIRYSDYDLTYKAQKPTDFWGNINLPFAPHDRPVRTKRKGKYMMNFYSAYRSNRAENAKIPLGVSEAVLEGVKTDTMAMKGQV